MIKIFEKTQQLNDISTHQSKVIECESFQYYFEIKFKERWIEYIHYAEVIG